MNWTDQQQAIFLEAENGSGSFNVKARAGTSKTTTGVEVANRIKGRTLLCAYNKSIAEELSSRIIGNYNATAATTHSIGFSLFRKIRPSCEVDSRKDRGLAKALHPWDKPLCDVLVDATSYAKQAGFGVHGCPDYKNPEAWTALFDRYDLWDEVPNTISPEKIVSDCTKIYSQSIELAIDQGRISFDDMLTLPLVFSQGKYGLYDTVIADEAQDLSDVRRLMILHIVRDGGRVIGLGDDRQAIYQWAGASHDSMRLLKDATKGDELPLTITFRCPKRVVKLAQNWVPDFQAHESAPEGVVRLISHTDFWLEYLQESDVILCRNTRPLIGVAKRLRDNGVPCVVEGQNGKSLIALVVKWGEVDIRTLSRRLVEHQDRETEKWKSKGREDKVEWVQEKVGILLDLMEDMPWDDPARKLVTRLEMMFGQGQSSRDLVRLCTIHRYKGREADRVYLLGRNRYQPSKWAKREEDILAEDNLQYVAVTRVKRELVEVYVPVPGNGQEKGDWWEL